MIDLHSHILPGPDDGAESLEDALAMARMALDDGIARLVATPHNADWPAGYGRAAVEERLQELKNALASHEMPLEVLAGVEVYMAPDLPNQMEAGRAFTLNGSHYMLVELPLLTYPHYTEQVFFELQVRRLRPILAHPERNRVIQEDPSILFKLVERGILGQVTAASLVGVFGTKVQAIAERFLEQRLVHIIASDAHGIEQRSPVLSAGVEAASHIIGLEPARAMVERIPERILADEEFLPEPPLEWKPRRRWFWQRR